MARELKFDSINEKNSDNDNNSSINGRVFITDDINNNEVIEGEKGGTLDRNLYNQCTNRVSGGVNGCATYCESCGSFKEDTSSATAAAGGVFTYKINNNSAYKIIPSRESRCLLRETKDSFNSDGSAANIADYVQPL